MSDRIPFEDSIYESDAVVGAATRCYCCTCWTHGFVQSHGRWDPACANHGAHGVRGCVKHGTKSQDCDCGCDYKVVSA